MKYRSLLTVALIISSAMTLSLISAEVEQTTQQARPYQPFTPVAIYQGGFYPVIGVEDDEPLISVEGRLLSLGKDAAVYFWSNNTYVTPSIDTEHQIDRDIGPRIPNQYSKGRSQGFEDPIQKAQDQKKNRQPTVIDLGPTDPYRENRDDRDIRIRYWEQIIPRKIPLVDAYGVFIHYGEEGITDLMWRKIKYTRKDKKLTLSVPLRSGNRFKEQEEPIYMLLVFQNGEERIPFDHPQREGFLMWNEGASMEKMAHAYERSSANQTLDPILIFRPHFVISEASHNELRGIVVSALLNITNTGTVSDVYLDNALEPTTSYELMQSLRSWKFLPAIKDGERVEEEVEIPLQF